jgi:uncharacterized protein YbaP (TraB family)
VKFRAAALALLIPSMAVAQSAPPNAPVQDWSNIETVTVLANLGPALWHISRNGSDVWLLGTISPMPKALDWNKAPLTDIIAGARMVYLPPQLKAGFFETSWFLLTGMHKIKQPDDQTLRATLPADLRARYEGWMTKLGKKIDDNDDYLAAIAALDLEGLFRDKFELDGKETGAAVERIADHADVPSKSLATYRAMPVVDEVQAMSPETQRLCMKAALDDIDTQSANAKLAAQAWATGDLAGIKAHYSETKLNGCFEKTKTFAAARDQIVALAINAVNESLSKSGKNLIVIDIGYLLRANGLLDRLAAQGITVEGPPG